jgi:hypothetical protein
LSDSWNAFWEKLIVEGVAVLVASFVVQGLWFLGTDLLVGWNPGFEPALLRASARLGWVWVLGTMGMLAWVALRARGALETVPSRR